MINFRINYQLFAEEPQEQTESTPEATPETENNEALETLKKTYEDRISKLESQHKADEVAIRQYKNIIENMQLPTQKKPENVQDMISKKLFK